MAQVIEGGLGAASPETLKSDALFTQVATSLANGATIDTGFLDMQEVDKYKINFKGDAVGLSLTTESKTGTSDPVLSNTFTYNTSTLFLGSFPVRQRYVRFILTNNTGTTVTNVSMEVICSYGSADKTSVFPLSIAPLNFSSAALVQSVLKGQDPSSNFLNVGVNEAGALLTSDFGTEVARGLYSGYEIEVLNGRNPDIDTGTTPEDMWNGSTTYSGFNATANENIEVFSASANDVGSLVSSGTATGGSSTTLVDSSATFVTDGVAVGDVLLNDTQGVHGSITAVTETTLTIFRYNDGPEAVSTTASGDSYRVATSAGTGAAVLRLPSSPCLLNADLERQTTRYVILNGTSSVTLTGDFYRCSNGDMVLAGSSGLNEGNITVRQAVTTANVFCVIPTFGKTTIGTFTVPKGKLMVVEKINAGIVRASGSAGSATIVLNYRPFGGAFNGIPYEVSTSTRLVLDLKGGYVFSEGTDVKFSITDVSDNNTVADASLEYFLIDT